MFPQWSGTVQLKARRYNLSATSSMLVSESEVQGTAYDTDVPYVAEYSTGPYSLHLTSCEFLHQLHPLH